MLYVVCVVMFSVYNVFLILLNLIVFCDEFECFLFDFGYKFAVILYVYD